MNKGPSYQPGDKLLDVYVVERVLGEGGFNDVYLARHQILPRRYAIKVLRSTVAQTAADLERLRSRVEREAIVLARFDHPNLPTLHDMRLEQGAPVLVLEYLEGKDFGYVLDATRQLAVQDALYIGIEVAKPLSIAHQREIVHRDIKPENIFCMTEEPPEGKAVVRLLDFGASLLLGETKRLTRENSVIATMYYVAPESLQGAGKPDHRVDIYALGLVLWESLAGFHPFDPNDQGVPATRMGLLQMDQPVPYLRDVRPDVPTRFADVLAKMVAKNPGERPATMQNVYDELWAVLSTMQHSAERMGQRLPSIFTRQGMRLPDGQVVSSRRHRRRTVERGGAASYALSSSSIPTERRPSDAGPAPAQAAPNSAANPALVARASASPAATQESPQLRRSSSGAVAPLTLPASAEQQARAAATPRGTELLPNSPLNRQDEADPQVKQLLELAQSPNKPGHREALEAALGHTSPAVRKAATQGLSRANSPLSRTALERALASERDIEVRSVMALTLDLMAPAAPAPGLGGTVSMNDGSRPAGFPSPQSPLPKPAAAQPAPTLSEEQDGGATFIARLAASALTAPRLEERERSLVALQQSSPVHAERVTLAKQVIDPFDARGQAIPEPARVEGLARLRSVGVDQFLLQAVMRGLARPPSERIQRECLHVLAEEGDQRHAGFLEQMRRDQVLPPPFLSLLEQALQALNARPARKLPALLPPISASTEAAAKLSPTPKKGPRKQDLIAIVAAMLVVLLIVATLLGMRVFR